ncbi:MAG: anti-sigma factor family protein [Blastocatellia bacterium]
MRCDDFREHIFERLPNELSPEQAKEFDSHAHNCAACQAMMRDWQRLEILLRASWPDENPLSPVLVVAPKASYGWLHAAQKWIAASSAILVGACLLLIIILRPSVRAGRQELSFTFGRANPVAGLSQPQVQAWVHAAVEQAMSEQSERLRAASMSVSKPSSEEDAARLVQLSVQLEIIKEAQSSLWQQVQQQGLYLQSASLGFPANTAPSRKTRANIE